MSNLQIYNSLTRQLELFKSIEPGKVKIYVCGPTVYDHAHLGHARCYIIWDIVTRYLEFRGYKLQYVRNITDVDDKIIKRAKERNISPAELTAEYIKKFDADMKAINIKKPTLEPKATEYIDEMISFIAKLIEKGNAYNVDGDVYFRINSYKKYGELAHQNLEDLISGARVEQDSKKENQLDFALWKSISDESEIHWDSPWGKGRPGWHSECCAMIHKLMGDTIDIHAGGLDLAFPHHENEKAQAESYTGKTFVNYWMHNGFVNVESEKMSKSLDNFQTIKELTGSYDSNTIRLFILTNHYRMPVDFRNEALTSAKKGVKKIINAVNESGKTLEKFHIIRERFDKAADLIIEKLLTTNDFDEMKEEFPEFIDKLELSDLSSTSPWARKETSSLTWRIKEFISSMDNDFNTSKAIAILFDLSSMIQKNKTQIVEQKEICNDTVNLMALETVVLEKLATILGFNFNKEETGLIDSSLTNKLIESLIELRNQAREGKNWAIADSIRDKLKGMNIIIKDNKDGTTTWELDE